MAVAFLILFCIGSCSKKWMKNLPVFPDKSKPYFACAKLFSEPAFRSSKASSFNSKTRFVSFVGLTFSKPFTTVNFDILRKQNFRNKEYKVTKAESSISGQHCNEANELLIIVQVMLMLMANNCY